MQKFKVGDKVKWMHQQATRTGGTKYTTRSGVVKRCDIDDTYAVQYKDKWFLLGGEQLAADTPEAATPKSVQIGNRVFA